MRIEIANTNTKSTETFEFIMFDLTAVFVGWKTETVKPGKRKYSVIDVWDKYSSRNSTVNEPELPLLVKEKIKDKIIEKIKILTWKEFKPNDTNQTL